MGTRVTISDHRILHVDGRPFFPIAARHMPIGATPAMLHEIGFNAMRWTPFGSDDMEEDSYEVPDDFGGLMVYPYVYNRGDLSTDTDVRRRELIKLVKEMRDHANMLVYEQRNETAYTHRNYAQPQSPPEGLMAGSRVIRELDLHHPIRVGHANFNLVSTLRKYNEAVDIVGCNPYVISPPGMRPFIGCRSDGLVVDCPNQTLSAVGELTTKMMRVAEGRPVWMQLQALANENWFCVDLTPENRGTTAFEHHRLYPTRWQMRFMAFNAIIRGATALAWALYGVRIDISSWKDICDVIGELRRLHDILASPVCAANVQIEYTELGFGDWSGVETLVKLHGKRPWMLAVNTQFDPMKATFSNLPDGMSGGLTVFEEDRQIPVVGGKFTDYFRPYEVHIYSAAVV